jgi:hypothetical protein
MEEKTSIDNNNIKDAISFLDKSLLHLINGTVPMDKLSITKALREFYKNPQQVAHNVLAECDVEVICVCT